MCLKARKQTFSVICCCTKEISSYQSTISWELGMKSRTMKHYHTRNYKSANICFQLLSNSDWHFFSSQENSKVIYTHNMTNKILISASMTIELKYANEWYDWNPVGPTVVVTMSISISSLVQSCKLWAKTHISHLVTFFLHFVVYFHHGSLNWTRNKDVYSHLNMSLSLYVNEEKTRNEKTPTHAHLILSSLKRSYRIRSDSIWTIQIWTF